MLATRANLWTRMAAVTGLALVTACGYILPATWRSFRADPDDAAPAITRALAAQQLEVAKWDTAAHRITSGYVFSSDGVDRMRERYVVTWERTEGDGTLTIFVRHEGQDQGTDMGRPTWERTYHDTDKENVLLDAITQELIRLQQPMPSKS